MKRRLSSTTACHLSALRRTVYLLTYLYALRTKTNDVMLSVELAVIFLGCNAALVVMACDDEPASSSFKHGRPTHAQGAARLPVDVETIVDYDAFERLFKASPSFPFGKVERVVDMLGEMDWMTALMQHVDEFNIQMNLIRMHNRLLQKSLNVILSGNALNQSQAVLAVINNVSKYFTETLELSSNNAPQ